MSAARGFDPVSGASTGLVGLKWNSCIKTQSIVVRTFPFSAGCAMVKSVEPRISTPEGAPRITKACEPECVAHALPAPRTRLHRLPGRGMCPRPAPGANPQRLRHRHERHTGPDQAAFPQLPSHRPPFRLAHLHFQNEIIEVSTFAGLLSLPTMRRRKRQAALTALPATSRTRTAWCLWTTSSGRRRRMPSP